MEFIKATIKNYRVHKEQVVDFNSNLTLVGGDNEKGKSTIAEAIYRALFLKADGQSEAIEGMKSTKHLGGDPEVELVFRSNGKVFTLSKKFGKKCSHNFIPTLCVDAMVATLAFHLIKEFQSFNKSELE